MLVELLLAGLLLQTDKPATVPLVIDGQVQITETASAERLYEAIEQKRQAGTATEEDNKLHAALTATLGTMVDSERLTQEAVEFNRLHPSRREQLRWKRPPTHRETECSN